jgi:hypothetical protein
MSTSTATAATRRAPGDKTLGRSLNLCKRRYSLEILHVS